jgi:hypothetical protein
VLPATLLILDIPDICQALSVPSSHRRFGTALFKLSLILLPSFHHPTPACSFRVWLFSRSSLQWDEMFFEGICFPNVFSQLYYLCLNSASRIWQNNKCEQISEIVILSFYCITGSKIICVGKWFYKTINIPFMRECKQCSKVIKREQRLSWSIIRKEKKIGINGTVTQC